MSLFSKRKRDIDRRYFFKSSEVTAKFFYLRNVHDAGDRFTILLDARVENDSLLQRIRVKFGMPGA